jgi:hypothetical protein
LTLSTREPLKLSGSFSFYKAGMSHFQARMQDMQFVLSNVLSASDQLQKLSLFSEIDDGLVLQVLDEPAQFVVEVIEPKLTDNMLEVKERWHSPARAFQQWALPEFVMRSHIIETQCEAVP